MLLGNRHIMEAIREAARELHHPGAFAHCRGDADQPLLPLGHVTEPVTEYLLVLGPHRFWLAAGEARCRLDLVDRVVADRVVFRGCEAFAFHGHHMQQLGAFEVTHVAQRLQQRGQVMAIDRADIIEAQLLEQGARRDHALHMLFGPPCNLERRSRQARQNAFAALAHVVVERACPEAREIRGEPTLVARDRHLVVVQDNQQVRAGVRGMVQRLESHARGHCAVADHRHYLALLVAQARSQRHAERGADTGARMTNTETVVFAFAAVVERRQPAGPADTEHCLAPATENLVRIALVTDIPDQPVMRGVEQVMKRDGEFHDAQAGAEMATCLAHRVQQVFAQLIGQPGQAGLVHGTQVRRQPDAIQQRRGRPGAGDLLKQLHDAIGCPAGGAGCQRLEGRNSTSWRGCAVISGRG